MGLILREDNIKIPTESGGSLFLAESVVTLRDVNNIPVQQFVTPSLNVVLGSLAASRKYNIYVVAPGGVPQLVFDLSENSSGPAGFDSWKLVGAFFSSWDAVFGGFVRIDVPVDIDISFQNNSSNVLNASVIGLFQMSANNDVHGLMRPQAGAYNSATGVFATQQPAFIAPIAGNIKTNTKLVWNTSGAANFTNTWRTHHRIEDIEQFTVGKNARGANSSASLTFMESWTTSRLGLTLGQEFTLLGFNDVGNFAISISSGAYNFKTAQAIKDL